MSDLPNHAFQTANDLRFAAEIQQYLKWMDDLGFSDVTMRRRMSLLTKFDRYLKARGVARANDFDGFVQPFVDSQVQKARKRGRSQNLKRLSREFERSVRHFIRYLRDSGHIEPMRLTNSGLARHLEDVLQTFIQSLEKDRALAAVTIRCYKQYATEFLVHVQETGVNAWPDLTPHDVDSFLQVKSQTVARRAMRVVCATLRNILSFLRAQGFELVAHLENFPRPRVYQQEDVPIFLRGDQVREILGAIDRRTRSGVRNYAILLLLVTYGMRAMEVARLTLEDVDWCRMRLRLKNRKSGRTDHLPLSTSVGEAILEYLQTVRPTTRFRQIFLPLRAPIRPFKTGATVSHIAADCQIGAGIELPRHGAHVFRHTTAQHLLTEGFTFKAIGDYLGHASAAATGIYLKVDIDGLREVALNDGEELL